MIKVFTTLEYNRAPVVSDLIDKRSSMVVRKIAYDMEADARANAPIDLGNMANEIRAEEQDELTWTVTAYAEQSIYVEHGTRPHMPPVDAIRGWAERHGWDPWALAMHIKEHGTRANPFMGPAAERQRAPFYAAMSQILRGL